MIKKLILMINCLFLLACSNNDNYYSGYTRLEKPKTEMLKNYSESQEEVKKKQEESNFDNGILDDVARDLLDLGLKAIISVIIPN